ncbi:VCBS repeat-containing protein [Paenarthrobacter sp. Z7-10]|uniref:CAP domain-containing protein n=1 Tax=Paenarthrobacter sp. Z7-10 TaxID=2787635 RepID=UPI0022A8F9F7|nr:CAP domain-containing protein [Paenarthrobacter sp. Z7-10]MCZ2404683.1 VCBS repeat-containing protein [Paenarthrobacter sp. Z7-10]
MRKISGLFTAFVLLLSLLLTGGAPALAAAPTTAVSTTVVRTASTPMTVPSAADPFVKEVLRLTNQYRADNGLTRVVWNAKIAAISQQWAATIDTRIDQDKLDMATIHRPAGWGSLLPEGYDWYSEIIAINNTPQQVVDWWMNSPSHRAALLDPRVTDVGIGYVRSTKAGWAGMYSVVLNLVGYPSTRATLPPMPVIKPGDVAVVDVDGGLYVYSSAHGADLWQRKYISSGWGTAQQIEVTDWNSDGISDLVTVWNSGRLTVSYGQSNGLMGPLQVIGNGGWAGYDISVTTWSRGDVYPSILATNRATGGLYYYRNTTGGVLNNRTQIGVGWRGLTTLSLDFDADGYMDVVARTPQGQLKLYRGNGAGRFVSESRAVIGNGGWNAMDHISSVTNHLGDEESGILARDTAGNLQYYPVGANRFLPRITIGHGGWTPLLIGS